MLLFTYSVELGRVCPGRFWLCIRVAVHTAVAGPSTGSHQQKKQITKKSLGCDLSSVEFLRLGTCGGLGVPGGTVVITKEGYDARLRPGFEHVALGEVYLVRTPQQHNKALADAWSRALFL